jgi:hypothetical protein
MTTYQLAFSAIPTHELLQLQKFLTDVQMNRSAQYISKKQREHAFSMRAKLSESLAQRKLLEDI